MTAAITTPPMSSAVGIPASRCGFNRRHRNRRWRLALRRLARRIGITAKRQARSRIVAGRDNGRGDHRGEGGGGNHFLHAHRKPLSVEFNRVEQRFVPPAPATVQPSITSVGEGIGRALRLNPSAPARHRHHGHSGVSRASNSRSLSGRKARSMSALAVGEAYRLWAPSYSDETAISFLENKLVNAMTPSLAGLRLLDAGCGTGRRIRNAGASMSVAVEPCREMLAAGIAQDGALEGVDVLVGDVRECRFAAGAFDVVWCRLVLGHMPNLDLAYSELARVTDNSGLAIVSDFHPAAVQAGHRRSFRTGERVIELEHYVHSVADHIAAASAAGLQLKEIRGSGDRQ